MAQCEECLTRPYAKGFCRPHYYRVRRTGAPSFDNPLQIRGIHNERARFFRDLRKEEQPGCWIWHGVSERHGHFRVHVGNGKYRFIGAHRYSWLIHFGEIPKGLLVCHKCDVPGCVNPDHLFLGTAADNAQDSAKKGRTLSGSRNAAAKLNVEDILKIRVSTLPATKLSLIYEVSEPTIMNVKKRTTWKNVP